jgi:pyrimidine deaminase RibD-like protein
MANMETLDLEFMEEAIRWADACQPAKQSIPKVGAVVAVGPRVIGRGRWGTGVEGDDRHAEEDAIKSVQETSLLAQATLYTTLEPCTPDVRRDPTWCCTELIRRLQIKRVFIGILDPNQGVRGKGLWRLQDTGVEVALFPHDLSKKIRIQNEAFIRFQEGLRATIVTPKAGDILRTYESGGKQALRFTCVNGPGPSTYLLIYKNGQYWPQPDLPRFIEQDGVWEIVAHFGATGDHELRLVTADDLGNVLIQYYRKVVDENLNRRRRLRAQGIDVSTLGGDYPGIQMSGLPKGLRIEASVAVYVAPAPKVTLVDASVEPKAASPGKTLTITYVIESSEDVPQKMWLGASFKDKQSGRIFYNTKEDKPVALAKGRGNYVRDFTIATDAPIGGQFLGTNVWRGVVGDSSKSELVASRPPIPINIVR